VDSSTSWTRALRLERRAIAIVQNPKAQAPSLWLVTWAWRARYDSLAAYGASARRSSPTVVLRGLVHFVDSCTPARTSGDRHRTKPEGPSTKPVACHLGLARPVRFERTTFGSVDRRSIQLRVSPLPGRRWVRRGWGGTGVHWRPASPLAVLALRAAGAGGRRAWRQVPARNRRGPSPH